MFKFVFIASLLVCAVLAAPVEDEAALQAKLEEQQEQNKDAKYDFGIHVDDDINDGQIQREEHRENGKTVGFYKYSDGFVRRTVHYEADENGYRVVKETTDEIGNGPVYNSDGQAEVFTTLTGNYTIKEDKSDKDKHYTEIHQ